MEWTNVGYVALSLFTVECIMHCSQPTVLVLGTPPLKKGFPWNWVPELKIKNANDGAIGLIVIIKQFDNNFHLRDRRMDR